MAISWGYSPKIEKYIPLADFPADKYLIIARKVIENLGWKLSHISKTGIIAYTPISFQSYTEEISIRIHGNFAVVKSECVGIQMLFNDYGKNDLNLEKFFNEFEYVQFHLQDIWEDSLTAFHALIATQDDTYFEKAPLTAKDKIKNILYLFLPQKGYLVTPILIILNIIYYGITLLFITLIFRLRSEDAIITAVITNGYLNLGANSRELVLEGQLWHLFTHQFIHLNISHVFFNLYALVYIGLMVENKLGSVKFLFTYLLSGICGGLVSIIFHKFGFMAGASGAIMGIFGAFMALIVSKAFEKNASRALLISTVVVTAIMLLNGISGNVDNSAHIGGLVSGFIICYLLFNEKLGSWKITSGLQYGLSSMIVVVFAAVVLTLTPNYQNRKFYKLQFTFDQNISDFNKVYSIPRDLSKAEKVKMIEQYGIQVWRKNKQIVAEMKKLRLEKKENYRRDFDGKITNLAIKISELLYREYLEETSRYRDEIEQLTDEVNVIRGEASTSEFNRD
ncbi:hypothetical protein OC25_06465 [Pedobacter kyungheensis]|uniref:Peptidase S54 rhomboid domain-containing protein n=1 Tax=Pedobacter kyungheensis TaxID=1069985 RepID=A0A0C1DN31_9SPHI|nr:rhomboid family intramembrane serine protease [Pedobacter kyungheensis]KIA95475.1 hypothetical protein OC25_06465 [Pedobacter kyungheensis]